MSPLRERLGNKTDNLGKQRKMLEENGGKVSGTPGERKASRQEEIKDLDILWLKIKEEFKQSEAHMENKLGEVQEMIDKK